MKVKQSNQIAYPPIQGLDEEKYKGKWLLINQETGRIVAVEDSLGKARQEADNQSIKHFGFYRVPTFDGHYHISVK